MTTRELIERLRETHAFDPRPVPADLATLHVPFDSLVHESRTEQALARAASADERVALIGGSGVGKSSVIAHVFGFESSFAPIWLSVANERPEVATDPGTFSAHAVQVLARYAEDTDLASPQDRDRYLKAVADRRVLPSSEKGVSLGVKLAPWIGELGVQGDLKRISDGGELTSPASEHVLVLDEMIALVRTTSRRPILILDDSDRWFNVADDVPREEIVGPFLTAVLRMLADRAIGFVAAVHESYGDLAAYIEATRSGTFDTQIRVPALRDRLGVEAVLTHRVWVHTGRSELGEVFEDAAREELWRAYGEECRKRVRDLLQVAQGALVDADVTAIDEPIGREQVLASIADALGR